MGAILDSAEDIRQNKKNPPRQAYKTEEKLEKDKDKGVKMIPAVADLKSGEPKTLTMFYNGQFQEFKGEMFNVTVFGGLEQTAILISPQPHSKLNGNVPDQIKPELEEELKERGYNKKPIYPK